MTFIRRILRGLYMLWLYGTHWEWKPFIEKFIQNLDVERIQAQL